MKTNSSNRVKYKKAFSVLHMESPVNLEEANMKNRRSPMILKPAAAFGLAAAIFAGSGAAYAADLGGIRTTVEGWFHGGRHTFDVEETKKGEYMFTDPETGESFGGGGIAYINGKEVQLSPEEVLQGSTETSFEKTEDGRWMLYLYDQSFDLTDDFRKTDKLKVSVTTQKGVMYFNLEVDSDGNCSLQSSMDPDGSLRDYISLDERAE